MLRLSTHTWLELLGLLWHVRHWVGQVVVVTQCNSTTESCFKPQEVISINTSWSKWGSDPRDYLPSLVHVHQSLKWNLKIHTSQSKGDSLFCLPTLVNLFSPKKCMPFYLRPVFPKKSQVTFRAFHVGHIKLIDPCTSAFLPGTLIGQQIPAQGSFKGTILGAMVF